MSYIKSDNTYAYPNSDGDMMIHSNTVIDQATTDIGSKTKGDRCYRWLMIVDKSDFRQLVREILTRSAPAWVTKEMVNDTVNKFFEREKC